MYQHFSQPSPTIGNRLKSKSFNQQNIIYYDYVVLGNTIKLELYCQPTFYIKANSTSKP